MIYQKLIDPRIKNKNDAITNTLFDETTSISINETIKLKFPISFLKNASPEKKNELLFQAIEFQPNTVELLLQSKANPNAQLKNDDYKNFSTPLALAVYTAKAKNNDDTAVVKNLLKANADINNAKIIGPTGTEESVLNYAKNKNLLTIHALFLEHNNKQK